MALAATGHPLRPISHEATLFVPPALARFTQTGDLIARSSLPHPAHRHEAELLEQAWDYLVRQLDSRP